MKIRTLFLLLFSLLMALPTMAQTQQQRQMRRQLMRGNKEYRDSLYEESEVAYLKAISKDSTNAVAHYNLSCARLHRGTGADTIVQSLQVAAKLEKDRSRQARIFHNAGWINQALHAKMKGSQGMESVADSVLRNAIEYYKESLRRNPNDDETRYNLVLCQRQLPKNDDGGGGGGEGQDQQQEDEQQQQQQEQQQQQQEQEQQQQQQQPAKMSQQNAEQMLNAVLQDERRTLDKVNKHDVQPSGRRLRKQW